VAANFDPHDLPRLVVPVLAGILFFISVQAYRRTRTTRVLFFLCAFALYFVKSLFISTEILVPEQNDLLEFLGIVADVGILGLFFFGALKR
jgi:hypothetical protein